MTRDLPQNLPNLLTFGRIAAVPLAVLLILLDGAFGRWAAFLLFAAAAATDYYDGMLARKMDVVSPLGVFLDPIADKVLVTAVILALTASGQIAGWDLAPALLILCREILVSGLREFLAGAAVTMPVSRLAKWKTALQLAALALLIVTPKGSSGADLALILFWAAALLTAISGWDYLSRGLKHIKTENR